MSEMVRIIGHEVREGESLLWPIELGSWAGQGTVIGSLVHPDWSKSDYLRITV